MHVQPGNILIELPISPHLHHLLVWGFAVSLPHWSICSPPASQLSQACPHDSRGVWLVGTMWPQWSLHPPTHPSTLSPSPGQTGAGWRAREIFLWLHQGVPGSCLSRGCSELLHHWGFPSCTQCPAFSSLAPLNRLGFSHGSLSRAKPQRRCFPCARVLVGDVCWVVPGVHDVLSSMRA